MALWHVQKRSRCWAYDVTAPLLAPYREYKQLPQNLRRKRLGPRAIILTAWPCPSAAILPHTLQVLLIRSGMGRVVIVPLHLLYLSA
jgi:hypothetical protein